MDIIKKLFKTFVDKDFSKYGHWTIFCLIHSSLIILRKENNQTEVLTQTGFILEFPCTL